MEESEGAANDQRPNPVRVSVFAPVQRLARLSRGCSATPVVKLLIQPAIEHSRLVAIFAAFVICANVFAPSASEWLTVGSELPLISTSKHQNVVSSVNVHRCTHKSVRGYTGAAPRLRIIITLLLTKLELKTRFPTHIVKTRTAFRTSATLPDQRSAGC